MTVTVVVRRQALPGQADALLALAFDRLRRAPSRRARRLQVRVFQHLTDPHFLLWAGYWETEADYWARTEALGGLDELDALCAAPADHFVFHRLAHFENMSRIPAVVQCALIRTAPETTERVVEFLQTQRAPVLKQSPGLLLRELHQDRNVPTLLCAIHGWESQAALERHEQEGHPHFESRAQELGARVEYFQGLTRAHVDRYTET
jgi:quinol monooxygenase YgiN